VTMSERNLMLPDSCTLDHDGCVTCSDAGIPVRVISVEGDDALCEDAAGNRAQIAIELVAPVQVREVLLTHGGVAIGRVAAQEEDVSEVRR
jgi:hydrogenase expression/formation protein HypC